MAYALTSFLILLAVSWVIAAVAGWAFERGKARRAPKPLPPFDVRAARRHAHSLGLPFPEADGTVSWPGNAPVLDQAVHDARAQLAQAGVSTEEALDRIERCIPHLVQDKRAEGATAAEIVAALDWRSPEREYASRLRMLAPCSICDEGRGPVMRHVRGYDKPAELVCLSCLAKR